MQLKMRKPAPGTSPKVLALSPLQLAVSPKKSTVTSPTEESFYEEDCEV